MHQIHLPLSTYSSFSHFQDAPIEFPPHIAFLHISLHISNPCQAGQMSIINSYTKQYTFNNIHRALLPTNMDPRCCIKDPFAMLSVDAVVAKGKYSDHHHPCFCNVIMIIEILIIVSVTTTALFIEFFKGPTQASVMESF